jgi:hypothetical protein
MRSKCVIIGTCGGADFALPNVQVCAAIHPNNGRDAARSTRACVNLHDTRRTGPVVERIRLPHQQ